MVPDTFYLGSRSKLVHYRSNAVTLLQERFSGRGSMIRSSLAFEGRILPVDTAVALRCAWLHVPNPRSERDALIAATAIVHQLTLVTRNVADFQPMGVDLLNPWQ